MPDFDSSLPVRTVSVEELQVQTKVGTNLNTDLKRINGTTISVNTGAADAGTQRVTLANDQAPVDVDVTGLVTDTEDNDIADGQTLPLAIQLPYGHNGTEWERLTSTTGSLNVNITGGASSGPTDTDDDNIAGGQSVGLSTGLNYAWQGANWERLTSTTGSLNVNITGGSSAGTEFAEDSAHTSGDAGTLSLVVRQDTLASSTSTDGDYATLKVNSAGALYTTITNASIPVTDNGGSLTVDGSVTVTAADLDIRDLAHTQDSIRLGDGTDFLAIAADGSIAVTDNGGSLTVDGTVAISGSVTVTATDLDIRDLAHTQDSVRIGDGTDLLAVNTDGSINVVVSSSTDKTNVFDYNVSADIATNGTSVHTYTPGANFYLTNVIGSASGKFKLEIQTGTTASETTKVVLFTSAERQAVWTLPEPLLVTTAQSVRIIRTNLDNQAQPLYSTVQGFLA